jgi:hypothetical protein
VSPAGGQVELVTDFKGSEPGDVANSWGLTLTNDPILAIRSLSANIYAVDWREP